MTTSLKKTLLAALVVPAIAVTAACTSSNDTKAASADRGSTGSATAPAAKPPQAGGGADFDSFNQNLGDTTALASTPERAAPAGGVVQDQAQDQVPDQTDPAQRQAIISKGQISLRSKDIDQARFDLQKLLDGLDATISDEQSSANKEGKTIRQRLVLRVPSAKFARAMDGISRLPGVTLVSRNRSSEDVTTQVIDIKTRVATQRASLARIQALLSQATNLQQVISIESQLSRRQAALDSLEAQQKYLADQTSLSTINVYLTAPSKKAASPEKDHNFFSGLKAGWDHLGRSTNALLIGIGSVLPFGVVLALVGVPAWMAWRRRNPRTVAAEA